MIIFMMIKEHLIKYKFNGLIWCSEKKFIFMKTSRTTFVDKPPCFVEKKKEK